MEWQQIVERLGLRPHPEGGWYREIYRSATPVQTPQGPRSALTTIYYLLQSGQASRWHRVDADEVWHFYEGDPLELLTFSPEDAQLSIQRLSPPRSDGMPVSVVPAGVWQAARCPQGWSLVGCSVGPGFEFSGFSLISSMPGLHAPFDGVLRPYRDLL